jgi:hypothetical protein
LFLGLIEQIILRQRHQHYQQQAEQGLNRQHRLILRQLLRLCQPTLIRLRSLVQQPLVCLQYQQQTQRHLMRLLYHRLLINHRLHQRQQLSLFLLQQLQQ